MNTRPTSTETPPADSSADPTARRQISLSVIMAGLNEEMNVERAVGRMVQSLERFTDEFEVIIINDGSTDRTPQIADEMAGKDARIRVVHNERNVNYGISLARGIQAARCEWILHDGMDLPLAPEDIDQFTPYFHESDVLVARRINRAAHSPWRKVTSWTNNMLLRILFAPKTADLNFVQFYRRSYAQSVQLVSTSPAFVTPELIIRAERSGRRVREVTIEFRRRTGGKAHFGKLHDIMWTLKDMLRFRLAAWRHGW